MPFDSINIDRKTEAASHPLLLLPREDLDLIAELVLQSGSLKELAAAYGVSYPTIRARLDRVIARLRGILDGRKPDLLSDLLAQLVERGEVSIGAARAVRELVRASSSAPQPTPSDTKSGGAT